MCKRSESRVVRVRQVRPKERHGPVKRGASEEIDVIDIAE